MKHHILEGEYVDEEQTLVKTAHTRVCFNQLTEAFDATLGTGSFCEVYGKNRFDNAIKIADLFYM